LEAIIIEIETNKDIEGVVLITLNRADRLNAMTQSLIDNLSKTLDAIANDYTNRVVIITGEGKSFSAGGDLSIFQSGAIGIDKLETFKLLLTSAGALALKIRSMPQPVIAAVNGPAAGGGFALAVAADIRICSESAYFSNAMIKLGLSGCEMGMSVLLPQLIGQSAAFELAASGRRVDASEAHQLGIVLETTSEKNLIKRAYEIALSFVANSPIGIKMTKQSMQTTFPNEDLSLVINQEIKNQLHCLATRDHLEALSALIEGREATFTGT
jgi:enoyl-CoA hydratase